MEAYDLSHKLAYAGRLSPVPFVTGPEFTNSVPVVPVLAMLRIFVEPQNWSEENVKIIAREVARALGPTEQYDIGITHTSNVFAPNLPASNGTARLTKLDPSSPQVQLLIADVEGDRVFEARYPRLQFEPTTESFWRSIYDTGGVKLPSQP
jgi:hypothetical protein